MLAVAAGLQCRRCSRRECQQTGLHRVWTLAVASYNVLYVPQRRRPREREMPTHTS
jgi:hypothetical protein